ncbi:MULTISPECIES: LysR substrate-binding domain-containing protein [unclassified Cupriavidus]|uniref:LysR substrate-binding domain-containing protein n=1 Tax=unclassified Cupriavidus TaxID=2640874 RepID=UPI00313E4D7A
MPTPSQRELRNMGIREIEIFRAVMTSGSMSKAAVLLGVSQPAVSQAIRKLETAAAVSLFARTRGRLEPTFAASALMSDVDRFFAGYEYIEHRIRSLRSYGLGRLTVAINPAFGLGFISRAIAAFEAEKRGVQISLQVMNTHEVHETVSAGKVEFGLMAAGLSMAGLEHSPFAHLRAVVVMRDGHPLARRRTVTPRDLERQPFIALNSADPTRISLENQFGESGVFLKPLVETPNSHTVCELALAGVGVGVSHPLVAADYMQRGLTIRPLSVDVVLNSVIAFRAGAPLSEHAKGVIRQMRVQLAQESSALAAKMAA